MTRSCGGLPLQQQHDVAGEGSVRRNFSHFAEVLVDGTELGASRTVSKRKGWETLYTFP